MDFKQSVTEMKEKGIETALIKRSGELVYSTFRMDDPAPAIIQYLTNNVHFLMKEIKDEAKEIEFSFENKFLIVVLLKNHIFLSLIKNRADKEILRKYISSIKSMF